MRGRTLTVLTCKALVLLALCLSLACAGNYGKLKPYTEIPQLARLAAARDSLEREILLVEAGEADGEPVRLAMERVGSGRTGRLIVMIHGLLSNRTVWRYMAGDLGRDHHLLLVDLLGCGDSDSPKPGDLEEDGYSPTSMARRVLLGLQNYMRDRGAPEGIVLVGHSLGGAVVFRMLGDPDLREEYSGIVNLVDGAVLMAPLDFAVEKEYPTFAQIAGLGQPKVAIASVLGILRGRVAKASQAGYVDPASAPREGARRQIDILKHRRTRRAARAMITQAVPFDLKARRPNWGRIEDLVAEYRNVDVPILMLWGSRDETLPVSMGYKLQSELPNARLRVVEESKHSLPTERPELCSAEVRSFIRGDSTDTRPVARISPEASRTPVTAALARLAGLIW